MVSRTYMAVIISLKWDIVSELIVFWKGQNQSGTGRGPGGNKKDDKGKEKKKYERPLPTRVGKRRKRHRGPDAANKLPSGKI